MLSAAAAAPGGMHQPSLAQRADAVALSIGSRVTVSTLLLACMLVIVIGASSMLSALHNMDRDLKIMNEHLAVANKGTEILNKTMDSLPPTSSSLEHIVGTVGATRSEVGKSKESLTQLAETTKGLNTAIGDIAGQTSSMRGSLQSVDASTGSLGATVDDLNTKIDPLAATQKQMLGETRRMNVGMGGMNASLAYVIRTLNYLTQPPGGGGMTVRVELDKRLVPPGIKVETDPVPVFARGAWPLYTGP